MKSYSLEEEAKRSGKFILRCLNTVNTKDGREVRCGHFVAELDDFVILTKCKKCGTDHMISKDKNDNYKVFYNPKKKTLIKQKEKS